MQFLSFASVIIINFTVVRKHHEFKMNEIKIIIEKTSNFYSSYAENVEGVYGGGNSADEAKTSALEAIALLKEITPLSELPSILQSKYDVVFCTESETTTKQCL